MANRARWREERGGTVVVGIAGSDGFFKMIVCGFGDDRSANVPDGVGLNPI
jgi:hypothetical protein